MRRQNTQLLSDVLREVLNKQHLSPKLNETRLIAAWEKVLGQTVAGYTKEKYIKNNVLYVKISSAVLRNELLMSREQLIAALNKEVGTEVITDIFFR
jgi:predicted nucleic acid-binding Zn ribbon protein